MNVLMQMIAGNSFEHRPRMRKRRHVRKREEVDRSVIPLRQVGR